MKTCWNTLKWIILFSGELALAADVLVLENGDRLTGSYLRAEEGKVYFRSDILGEIAVTAEQVREVEGEEVEQLPPQVEMNEPVAEPLPPVAEINDNLPESPKYSLLLAALDFFNPLKDWKSRLAVGYTWTSGENSSQDWMFLYEADRKREVTEWKVYARWDYGKTRLGDNPSVRDDDRYRAWGQYRRNIGKKWFIQTRGEYRRDNIREIEHEVDLSAGIGWRVWDSKRFALSLTPAYTGRYQQISGQTQGWVSLFSLFQEARYQIREGIIFSEEARIDFEPSDTSRADYSFTLKLENRLSERVSLDLRYEYRFTHLVGVGLDRKQQKFISALAYRF